MTMPESLELIVAGEAVEEIAVGVCAAIDEVLRRHGDDPDTIKIIAAGLALAATEMGVMAPALPRMLRAVLQFRGY